MIFVFILVVAFFATAMLFPALVMAGVTDDAADTQAQSTAVQRLLYLYAAGKIAHESKPAIDLSIGDIVVTESGRLERVAGFDPKTREVITAGIYGFPMAMDDEVIYKTGVSCSSDVWERETRNFVKTRKKVQP